MKYRQEISRRELLKWLSIAGAGAALSGCTPSILATPKSTLSTQTSQPAATAQSTLSIAGQAYLAVTHGDDPAEITRLALQALGGIQRFVRNGDAVILKPNICTDYHSAEYATTTNPEVMAELVRQCLGAGARQVRVMDNPFGGSAERAYQVSGVAEAVSKAGGEMVVLNPAKFVKTAIPEGRDINEWPVYQDILEANVLIDVPIAKHHGSARLTLGCKNLMGTIQKRELIHLNLHQRIADLTSLIRPDLTIIDAYRILMDNGPTGGNLNDVKLQKTIIASADIVAADAYACTLFGLTAEDVPYVRLAAEMGLGTKDLSAIKIKELNA